MSDERSCPLGHTCSKCFWHIQITGRHPSTGEMVNRRDCAMVWLPILTIENSQQQHQTNAAVDKLHNAVETGNQNFQRVIIAAAGNGKDRQSRLE